VPPIGRGDEEEDCSACRREDEQADEKRLEKEAFAHSIPDHSMF
jgi:hypothetical protein